MNVRQLLADDDAVSPVIGVILMVAITVILAAVIGTFVLNIGQDQQSTPQASFDFEGSGGSSVTVAHTGGTTFTPENTGSLVVSYVDGTGTDDSDTWVSGGSFSVGAGDSVTTSSNVNGGSSVEVVWTAPSGGESQILADYQVP